MVDNFQDELYSDAEMGRALSRKWSMIDELDAERNYRKFTQSTEPGLLVLNGSPSKEIAEKRAWGVATSVDYFAGKGYEFDILSPEEEFEWCKDILEETCATYGVDIHLSEEQIDREQLETAIDDVIAADNFTEDSDTIVYHTSSAHAKAVESAAETVHEDPRQYEVLGFNGDSGLDHIKQAANAWLQRNWYPRKRDY